MQQFAQIVVTGITIGAVYAMAALGFTIVFNATRVTNFAHGEFVMMGGLVAASLSGQHDVALPVAVGAAIVLVTALGVALDVMAIRQARRRETITLVMITIGAGVAFRGLMQIAVGRDVLFMSGFGGLPTMTAGGIYVQSQALWVMLSLAATSVGLWVLFARTRLGRAMRAASANPRAAALCGISPARMSALSYALAAGLGALAGALVAPIGSAFYETGLFFGLKGFAAAILGGLGNPLGAVVGGLLIGLVESAAAGYVTSGYKDAIALIALVILLLVRPSGLLGHPEVSRV